MDNRPLKIRILLLICLIHPSVVDHLVYGYDFENQPKIRTHEGTLILEAARDRNITLRLPHDSDLYFGDVNVLEEVQQILARRKKMGNDENPTGNSASTTQPTMESLNTQVLSMKRALNRLRRRITTAQNRTSGPVQVRRLNRFVGRLQAVESRLLTIQLNLQINECKKKIPCKNGGTCFDGYNSFHCLCPEGWTGKTCDEDVDECYLLTGTDLGCQNSGVCINTPGSYRCACSNGYTGTHCAIRNATCETAASTEICGHGICVVANNNNSYSCICDPGWTNNNVTTSCAIDIDECALATNPCHNGCINLPGSFKCEPCPLGYAGDGVSCTDVDECATNNGGCSSMPVVNCINTVGSYHCGNCPPGWVGDGRKCERVQSNTCNSANICHPRAKCEYISGTVVCTCPLGLFGHGFGSDGCIVQGNSTDPCADHVCQNNGICTVSGRGTLCICQSGFTGPLCEKPDACKAQPCQNGGTCKLLLEDNFSCTCAQGTTGKRCEIVRDICGAVLHQESGTINYPQEGIQYEAHERCAWIIRTANTKVLNVTFTKFDLEASNSGVDCSKDFLQVHDGRSLTSQLIGRFCGKALPLGGNFVSSNQQLFFWFRSDNNTNGDGFSLSWTSQAHSCGGLLELDEGDTGIIRSPGYPGKSPANRDCEWNIQVQFGYRLVLRIYEVILGSNGDNCTRDTLSIYDADLLLKRICVTTLPEPLHTSSNKAVVYFHTDGYLADSAFQLHYEVIPGAPQCGGLYSEPEGTIIGYMNAPVCEYLIQQPIGMTINLEFSQLALLRSNSCEVHKIEIFDGKSDNDMILKRLCGHRLPTEPIESSSNFMLLRYEFMFSNLKLTKEFQAKYRRVCEDRFMGPESGIITTPNYPNPYLDHITCTYDIFGPMGTVVHANFTDFSMTSTIPAPMASVDQNSSVDYENYVEVYLSKTNKRVFYKGEPMHLVSEGNRMRIVFHSAANSQKARGLRIEYDFHSLGCGGVLTGNETSFSLHDSFLSNYCEWIIEAPPGKSIHLELGYESESSTNPANDKTIYLYSNNTNGDSKMLGSSRNNFHVDEVFHTNILTIILKNGLDASNTFSLNVNYELVVSASACGGNFKASFGVIMSPGWPSSYLPSMECTWVVSAPLDHQIELRVHNFSIEYYRSDCIADYLEIRNGKSSDSPLIGKYCGSTIPNHIPSFTNSLYVHFESDYNVEMPGFYITWQHARTGCGGKLTSHTGSIHPPTLTDESDKMAICDWSIIVAEGSTVYISYTEENTVFDKCKSPEVLTFYDGLTTLSPVIPWDITQSTEKPNTCEFSLQSSQNKVFIRYKLQDEAKHFLIEYKTQCNNIITDRLQGVIETPNFPEPYPLDMNCQWDIRVGRTNNISLSFSHLNMEESDLECNRDFVEVIDMRNDIQLSKRRMCTQPAENIVSEGNRMVIKFVSDYSKSKRGFRVEYLLLGCGQHFYSIYGTFNTPNIPYSLGLDCDWYIEVPAGKQIVLIFREIFIETDTENCEEDAVIVSEEKNSSVPLLRECRVSMKNIRITSPANRLYIHFHTSDKRKRKFFSASYMSIEASCGGIFRSTSGIITSPNYPDTVSNIECVWTILVDNSFGIFLEFTDFNMTNSINCADGYIEIRKHESTFESTIQQHTCNTVAKQIFIQSNHISVKLSLNANSWAKFAITYKKQCGGVMSMSSGFLKAEPNHMCEWELKAPGGELISLDILHLECPCRGTPRCGMKIYFDVENDDNGFDLYTCLSNVTNFVASRFLVTANLIDFRAKFSTLDKTCGGLITSMDGILSAPTYQDTYPAKMECIWEFRATKGNSIELNLISLDIASSPHCNEDFLEIRTEIGGKVLGTFCGKELPSDPLTASRSIWIKFRSTEGSVGGKGFKISWSYAHDNEFNGTAGEIEPPPVNSAKAQEMPYNWRIFVARGQRVLLNFKQYNKGLNIYDGFDDTALVVNKEVSPWMFTSSSNVVYITTTNADLDYFLLSWSNISSEAVAENATITECNKVIILPKHSMRVNLSSPGYPMGYKPNMKCEWIIKADDPSLHAVLSLYEARLEDTNDCSVDYLRISTSVDLSHWRKDALKCMTPPMNPLVKEKFHGEPYLKVDFVSDATINGPGFTSMLNSECGSNMTKSVGTIIGNLALRMSNPNNTCLWHITVDAGKRIRFTIDFDQSPKSNDKILDYQFAIIYDGFDTNAPILPPGLIRDSSNQSRRLVLETSSNHATVSYRFQWTATLHNQNIWNLTYRQFSECDDDIILTHASPWVNISSPRYPNIPNPHTECTWIVVAPPGETVTASFIGRFSLVPRYCDKEFVEFRDGSTMLSRSLKHVCSVTSPTTSTGNVMLIRYVTHVAEPHTGFSLNISIAQCGGTLQAIVSGEITSPNYPALGGYSRGVECEFKIQQPFNARVRLNFTDIHLPYDQNNLAESSRLEVETLSENPVTLAVLYGNLTTFPVIETENSNVLVRFVPGFLDNTKYRGFRMKFNRNYDSCYRSYNNPSGRIALSRQSANHQTCQWRITVPKGQRVSLKLLKIEGHQVANSTRPSNRYSGNFAWTNDFVFFNDYEKLSNIVAFNYRDFNASQIIRSTDNVMVVVFQMRNETFTIDQLEVVYNADEASPCPENIDLETRSGRIDVRNLFDDNVACRIPFQLYPDETITFQIEELVVEKRNPNINQYAVRIKNEEIYQPFFGLNANENNRIVSIVAQRGSVSFIQNDNIRIKNFDAKYSRHRCGGIILLRANAVIEYPNINVAVPDVLECVWLLRAPYTSISFHIEGNTSLSDSCDREYISLSSAYNANYTEITRICRDSPVYNGTNLRGGVTIMLYHAVNYKPRQSSFSFLIEKSKECGSKTKVKTMTKDFIVDAKSYKNSIECSWEFEADLGMVLSIHFTGRFFIEDSVNCTNDYLEVLTYDNGIWLPNARFCGREVPTVYNTSANHILMNFYTDGEKTGDGFNFYVRAHCNLIVNVTDETKTIHMPLLDTMFEERKECTLVFQSISTKLLNIRIKLNKLPLENYKNFPLQRKCEWASFTAHHSRQDGQYDDILKSKEYCDEAEIHEVGFLKLQYRASLVMDYVIEYDLNACGGNVTAPREIHSINQNNEYRNTIAMNCVWYVTAPSDHSVVIIFKYFDMEYHPKCESDYFAIYKGPVINKEKKLQQICGNLTAHPPVISVDGNQAVIGAVSYDGSYSRGFSANILFVPDCNERIVLSDGNSPVFLSRQYKIKPSEQLYCLYKVNAPKGYRVSIQIRELELNKPECNRNNCSRCNHIEIFDSDANSQASMGQYCANERSNITRISSYENALLKLNATIPGEYAFEITLQMEPNGCGPQQSFTVQKHEHISISFPPNGEKTYPPNTHCTWNIEYETHLDVRFDWLLLQNASQVTGQCTDYVEIKSKMDSFSGKFCGNATGFKFVALYSRDYAKIKITFHSDDNIEDKGFRLSIEDRKDCNTTYGGLSGELNFYMNDAKTVCSDEIRVPEDYNINVYLRNLRFLINKCNAGEKNLKFIDINTNKTMQEYCENSFVLDQYLTSTNALRINTTSITNLKIFYIATPKSATPGCGGIIHSHTGEFNNPPYNDHNSSECRWEIIVPTPNQIQIYFNSFDMGSTTNCHLNYMNIFEVQPNGSQKLARNMCGDEFEVRQYTSIGSHIAIVAKKSPNFDGVGWSLAYDLVRPMYSWEPTNQFIDQFP